MGFRFRFLVLLVPGVLLVWGALFYGAFSRAETTIRENLQQQGFQHGMSQSREFQVLMEACRRSAKGLSLALEHVDRLTDADIQRLQDRVIDENVHIFGTAVALVPNASRRGRFAPYVFRGTSGKFERTVLTDDAYDYPASRWFREPIEAGAGVWSDPYFDKGGGNTLMTTYSTPVWDGPRVTGVATVDVDLNYLNSRLETLARGQRSMAFVITANQRVIGPAGFGMRSGAPLEKQGFRSAEFLASITTLIERPSETMHRLQHPFTSEPAWVLALPIELTEKTRQRWTLVAVFPEAEMLRELTQLQLRALVLVLLGLAVLASALLGTFYGLARPIERLVVQAERYSVGHYADTMAEHKGFREIRRLSAAFNHMGRSMLEQLQAVQTSTIQKEKYRSELLFASALQNSILPKAYPPFPDLAQDLDLFGVARPAREMGGDFFDFVRLNADRIAVVVADVSDKGTASALFASMTRSMLRELLSKGLSPQEAMRRANAQLCEENPSDMFVTVLLVDYEPSSGRLRAVSAGHDAPIALSRAGEIRTLTLGRALPLGVLPTTRYEATPFTLAPGETVLLYTDGATDALGADDERFGRARLTASLEACAGLATRDVCERLLSAVRAFEAGGEQVDDITLAVLARLHDRVADGALESSPVRHFTVELPTARESLPYVAAFADTLAHEVGLTPLDRNHVQVALEEVVMNLITHGDPEPSPFQIQAIQNSTFLELRILDSGRSFAFDTASHAYSGSPSLDRPVGGVGLFLVRSVMDEVRYEPGTIDGNRMVLVKRLTQDGAAVSGEFRGCR